MVEQSDICAGFDMRLNQRRVVDRVDHIIRCNHNIRIAKATDVFHIFKVGSDIRIVKVIYCACLAEQQMQAAALGVDVVVAACTDMLDKRARLVVDIDLDAVNTAVAHV